MHFQSKASQENRSQPGILSLVVHSSETEYVLTSPRWGLCFGPPLAITAWDQKYKPRTLVPLFFLAQALSCTSRGLLSMCGDSLADTPKHLVAPNSLPLAIPHPLEDWSWGEKAGRKCWFRVEKRHTVRGPEPGPLKRTAGPRRTGTRAAGGSGTGERGYLLLITK